MRNQKIYSLTLFLFAIHHSRYFTQQESFQAIARCMRHVPNWRLLFDMTCHIQFDSVSQHCPVATFQCLSQ